VLNQEGNGGGHSVERLILPEAFSPLRQKKARISLRNKKTVFEGPEFEKPPLNGEQRSEVKDFEPEYYAVSQTVNKSVRFSLHPNDIDSRVIPGESSAIRNGSTDNRNSFQIKGRKLRNSKVSYLNSDFGILKLKNEEVKSKLNKSSRASIKGSISNQKKGRFSKILILDANERDRTPRKKNSISIKQQKFNLKLRSSVMEEGKLMKKSLWTDKPRNPLEAGSKERKLSIKVRNQNKNYPRPSVVVSKRPSKIHLSPLRQSIDEERDTSPKRTSKMINLKNLPKKQSIMNPYPTKFLYFRVKLAT